LLVFQEIDFIDWIVSQRYKQDFYDYFDSVVEERTRLDKHFKNIIKDVRWVLENKPLGPISALSLSTFSITNKILKIGGVVIRVAEQEICDGLWRYLNTRMFGESHTIAWKDARAEMGWDPDPERIESIRKNTPSWARKLPFDVVRINESINQLEPWFAQLWDKWGEYIEPGGVSELAKQKVKEEIRTKES